MTYLPRCVRICRQTLGYCAPLPTSKHYLSCPLCGR